MLNDLYCLKTRGGLETQWMRHLTDMRESFKSETQKWLQLHTLMPHNIGGMPVSRVIHARCYSDVCLGSVRHTSKDVVSLKFYSLFLFIRLLNSAFIVYYLLRVVNAQPQWHGHVSVCSQLCTHLSIANWKQTRGKQDLRRWRNKLQNIARFFLSASRAVIGRVMSHDNFF